MNTSKMTGFVRIVLSNGISIICKELQIVHSQDQDITIENGIYEGIEYENLVIAKSHIVLIAYK